MATQISKTYHHYTTLLTTLLILAAFLSPSPSSSSSSSSLTKHGSRNSFCKRAMATKKTCPTPPTPTSFQIHKFTGRWYEIGSSANFKFRNEAGRICNQANYTLFQRTATHSPPGFSPSALSVINSAQPVMDDRTADAISQVSVSARALVSIARQVCLDLNQEEEPNLVAGKYSGLVRKAIANASVAVMGLEEGLDSLAVEDMHGILILNADFVRPGVGDLVERVDSSVEKTKARLKSIAEKISNISVSKNTLTHVASQMAKSGIPSYQEAAKKVEKFAKSMEAQLQSMSIRTDKMGKELNTIEASFKIILSSIGKPLESNTSFVTGLILQNSTSPGKLEATVHQSSGPIWIISINFNPNDQSYRDVLTYSCKEDEEGDIIETLFILSRNRRLDQKKVSKFMSLAHSLGLTTLKDEDKSSNPFILTIQKDGNCGVPLVNQ